MPSRSLRDSLSENIGDAVDYVRRVNRSRTIQGTPYQTDSDRARAAASDRPAVRGQSNRNILRDAAPRSLVNRKRNLDTAIDDASE